MPRFHEALKNRRLELGFKPKDVFKVCPNLTTSFSKIENGHVPLPIASFRPLSKLYGVYLCDWIELLIQDDVEDLLESFIVGSFVPAKYLTLTYRLGEALKGRRKRMNLSREAFAEQIGVSESMVLRYDTAKSIPPGPVIPKISEVLRLPMADLINLTIREIRIKRYKQFELSDLMQRNLTSLKTAA